MLLRSRLAIALSAALLTGCVAALAPDQAERILTGLQANRAVRTSTVQVTLPSLEVEGTSSRPLVLTVRYWRSESANRSGTPILFLHGTPSSLYTWNSVLLGTGADSRGLAADHDVVAVDLPGHGLSSPLDHYTWDRMVQFVPAFLDALSIERAILVGNSYGGELAWRTAVQVPQRVERLVLIGSAGYHRTFCSRPLSDAVFDTLLRTPLAGDLAARCSWKWIVRMGLRGAAACPDRVSEEAVEETYTLLRLAAPRESLVEMTRMETGDGARRIHEVSQPTLLIWGDSDADFPIEEHGARFSRDVPCSLLVKVPRAGHTVQVDQPARVEQLIREFVRPAAP